MKYDLKKIRQNKVHYTWNYFWVFFLLCGIYSYLISITLDLFVIHSANSFFVRAMSMVIFGIINKIVLLFRLNIFNMLAYNISHLIYTIGINMILYSILEEFTKDMFFIFKIFLFVIIGLVVNIILLFTRKRQKSIMDIEELALYYYDTWVSGLHILNSSKDIDEINYTLKEMNKILKEDSIYETYVITKEMQNRFFNVLKSRNDIFENKE